MGIEPTARFGRATGFEDRGGHQTPLASETEKAFFFEKKKQKNFQFLSRNN